MVKVANLKNIFLVLFVALIGMVTMSQEVMPQTIPCSPKVEGLHFTTPYYNYTPVLFPSMPFDVMFSYILIDSILRHSEEVPGIIYSFIERFGDNQIEYDNDTLNYMLKYLYKIMDYDPLLFWDYMLKGKGYDRVTNTFFVYDNLTKLLYNDNKMTGRVPNGEQKRRILRSFYILHIYVDTTTLFERTIPNEWIKDFTIVYAQVLDTIKGRVLPNINTGFVASNNEQLNSQDNDFNTSVLPGTNISISANVNLIFDYCNQWNLSGDNELIFVGVDRETGEQKQVGAMYDKDGNPWIKPKKEYIVILAPNYECLDDYKYYFGLVPVGGSYSRGMYPIEDGNVIDGGNVWGFGKVVPLEEFKQKFNNLLNEIKNYGE